MRVAARAVIYVCGVAAGVLAVGHGVERFLASIFDAPQVGVEQVRVEATRVASTVDATDTIVRRGHLQPTQDSWADQLRDPKYWASRRPSSAARPNGNPGLFWGFGSALPPGVRSNLGIFFPPQLLEQPAPRRIDQSTYRTVCVRLCDGAFFPLSFSTTTENFSDDADRCSRSCGTEARLFVYRNPGSDIEDMEDLDGRPYKKLATAFRYKTKYDEACKCRPHPWEEASTTRHKVYALEAARAKGSRVAEAELKDLKAKLRQVETDAESEKSRIAQAKLDAQKRIAADAKAAKAAARLAATGKTAKTDDASRAVDAMAPAAAGPLPTLTSTKRRAAISAPPSRQASLPIEPGVIITRLGTGPATVRIMNQSRTTSATR